jgi:hypothetical protein
MARREHPRYENTEWPEYEFREFPMMVYPGSKDGGKTPDPDPRRPGKFLQEAVTVASEDERRAALDLAPAEPESAPAPKAPKLVQTGSKGVSRLETPEDERTALLQAAETAGIMVDKSWSTARIQAAIDEARQEVV